MALARMRTLNKAYQMLKESDPDTDVTKNFLYSQLRAGTIPFVQVGNKRLINYDLLIETLSNTQQHNTVEQPKIRRIHG